VRDDLAGFARADGVGFDDREGSVGCWHWLVGRLARGT
jgi:hypothetical protein